MECQILLFHTHQSLLSDERNINKWGFIAGLKKIKNWGRWVSFCSESEGVGLQSVLRASKAEKARERERERSRFSSLIFFTFSHAFHCLCASHSSYFYILI